MDDSQWSSLENLIKEFDEPEDIVNEKIFTRHLTSEEYEENIKSDTEREIQRLVKYIDSHPESYRKVLRKRRMEEIENAGFFSNLKLKLLRWLHGDNCPNCIVNIDESTTKLNNLKQGMEKAFKYSTSVQHKMKSAKSKSSPNLLNQTHYSTPCCTPHTRKKPRLSCGSPANYSPYVQISLADLPVVQNESKEDERVPLPPPPPPLPSSFFTQQQRAAQLQMSHPPLPATPQTNEVLYCIYDEQENKEPNSDDIKIDDVTMSIRPDSSNDFLTPKNVCVRKRRRRTRLSRSPSKPSSNLLSDLQSANPLTRLKATTVIRSPGGTPAKSNEGTSDAPLQKALLIAFKKKFRNVRTPNSTSSSPRINSSGFSPRLRLSPAHFDC
ncbi:hypothetical protein LOTGIDRAFT_152954 [Lottia gigantea]|uniref:Uncharacterized protein n=1 Tax=Lottia gigantea TaxID=225164 RepID=V4A207_LOTGI|nr:hypothetical protein LOTGIDRAFT_152954 [Lottia gigantea]ESO97848.1 hypothetical protein LOTGIDRAFT_152954 [Lottia gigantea]